jgi:glutaminase
MRPDRGASGDGAGWRRVLVLLAVALVSVADARGPKAARDADYQMAIQQAHQRYAAVTTGKVASKPEVLAGVSPALFGIAIVRVDGSSFRAGDADQKLLLDAISAPFAAALLSEQQGTDVLSSVQGAIAGTAPLPDARGAADWGNAPATALESSGSMSLLALMQPKGNPDAKWQALRANLGRFAGHEVNFDAATHQAVLAAAEPLKARAQSLSQEGRLADDAAATADLFVRQNLVNVTTHDLAVMAATLANDGVNPVTRDRAVKADVARGAVTLLMNSGLRGERKAWLMKAGVGAMTSRAGAVMLVVPGRMGIAAYSPPLGSSGISARGERAVRYLIKVLMIGPDPTRP